MKETALRDTQIRSMHEMGEMKRVQELRVDEVSVQKMKRKSWDNTNAHFSVAGNAWTDEFYEWFRRFSRRGIKLQWEIVLRFSLQWFQVLVPCWAATNACLLTHGIHRDHRKSFLVINFLRLIHTRDHHQGIHSCAPQRERWPVPQATGTGDSFRKRWKNRSRDTIPMPTFARRPPTMSCIIPVEFPHPLYGWTAKTSRFRKWNSTIHQSTIFLDLEDTIQRTSDYLFWFSFGSCVVDEGSGDGWVFGRVEVLAITLWKGFSKLRDVRREDCFCSEQDHPELPVQEEGQPRGAGKPKERTSIYEEDRSPSWSATTCGWLALVVQCWLLLMYSLLTLHDDNIQEIDTRWNEVPLSMS